jgi:phenylalanyl-tRNA synthetase beta chain
MKFTLSWLETWLDTEAPLEEITEKLTVIGLEVEEIENAAEALSAFTVAEVLSAEQHPNADRLKVCMVKTADETVQVVCGAPNAHAGMKGVFAPSGTVIPGTGLKLKPTEIRGVKSNGMLCSEREMQLSDDHEGIIELPADAPIGAPFAEYAGLDDPVIEIAITPNRADCLGVRGIARDLAAAGIGTFKDIPPPVIDGAFDCPVEIKLEFDKATANACPAFGGRYIRGVKNGDSPAWLKQRLEAIGLRPVNALVDITNFLTYDRARPLHVYDADRLSGAIRARLGKKGDNFVALDGKTYKVDDTMCVIADDKVTLGLGGVIGGEDTGCTADTVNVFIESALFDPRRTAATGRKLGIESDARYRFERGVDPQTVMPGLECAAQMVLEMCGGEPSHISLAGTLPDDPASFDFDPGLVGRLSGLDVDTDRIVGILAALGFETGNSGEDLQVTAPSWRPDVHEPADLVEEVVRIIGVDNVPSAPMRRADGVARPVLTAPQMRLRLARRVLAARGLVEAVTWSFIPREIARGFGGGSDDLELANPISSEMSSLRPSLLPGLLTALGRNLDRGLADPALFEAGQAYRGRKPEDQFIAAAGVRAGTARFAGSGRHWGGQNNVDLFDAKADVLDVLAELGVPVDRVQITADAPAWFHPGRSGVLRLGPKQVLAHFGELHPAVLDVLDVSGPAVGFELFLSDLPAARKRASRAKPPLTASDLQPVIRDFAFVADKAVMAGDVIRAAQSADKDLIARVRLFDQFEGGALGEGKKSLGLEVTLQPAAKTLTDQDIDQVGARVVAAVEKATGASLRK